MASPPQKGDTYLNENRLNKSLGANEAQSAQTSLRRFLADNEIRQLPKVGDDANLANYPSGGICATDKWRRDGNFETFPVTSEPNRIFERCKLRTEASSVKFWRGACFPRLAALIFCLFSCLPKLG